MRVTIIVHLKSGQISGTKTESAKSGSRKIGSGNRGIYNVIGKCSETNKVWITGSAF